MSNIEANVYNTTVAVACIETGDGWNALPDTGSPGTDFSPAFSTRGHFGSRTVSVGSPVTPMLLDRRCSGLSQAIRSASRAQDDHNFRDAPHLQCGRQRSRSETPAVGTDAKSFESAQRRACEIAARYHNYGAASDKPHPAGRELAQILEYLSPQKTRQTLTPRTPARSAIHEAAALMADIRSGNAGRHAPALEARIARIEENLAAARCSRYVRSSDSFSRLFPAGHEVPCDADADPVKLMSETILLDCENAQGVLGRWLNSIESGNVAAFRHDRLSVSAPHERKPEPHKHKPHRSDPIPIPIPAAQEKMAVRDGLAMLEADRLFIASFQIHPEEDQTIDGEDLLLDVAAQVADYARKLR